MLKVFRDNLKNLAPVLWVVIAVFVLLMFAYPDGNPPTSAAWAATVNGREISFADYQQAYRGLEDRFRGIYGESYTPELARQIGLPMQALNSLVAQQIMIDEAEDLGLEATDEEVRNAILEYPVFQNERGQFDNETYQRVLRNNRLSADRFESEQREQILLRKFNQVLADSVWISDAEAMQTAREEAESAQIRYVKLTAADINEDLPITSDELQTYFSENQEDYRVGERRDVAYLSINRNVVRGSIEIPEEELRAYYDANPDEFQQEEQVRARHILLFVNEERTAEQAQAQLEELKARIEAGERFQELAREFSEDEATKERGGNLNWFPKNRMTPQFEEAAFGAEVGSIVGPIENQLGPRTGYHLIKVENKREGGLQDFESQQNRIRVRLLNQRSNERTETMANELAAELASRTFADAAELETYANENELVGYQSTGLVSRDDTIPGIGRNNQFIDAAFAAEAGRLSGPVRISVGWALPTAFTIEEPRIPELSEVEDDVRNALQQVKKDAATLTRLASIKAELGDGVSIEQVAEAAGKETADSNLIRTTGAVANLSSDPSFNQTVLEHNEGDLVGPIALDDGAVLFELVTRNRFDPEVFEIERDSTLQRLREQRVSSMLQALIDRRRGEIRLNISPQLQESFELPATTG